MKKSGTSFETVDWGTIGESATVFPAVTNSEALNIPQLSQNTLYHSQEFELAYDSYFNVTRYQDKAEMTANGISETIEKLYSQLGWSIIGKPIPAVLLLAILRYIKMNS